MEPSDHHKALQTANHKWGCTAGHKTNMLQDQSGPRPSMNASSLYIKWENLQTNPHVPVPCPYLSTESRQMHIVQLSGMSYATWSDRHPHFTESCCFHLQGRRWQKLNYNMNRDNSLSPKKTLISTLRKWMKTPAKGKMSLGFSNLTPMKAH
jgi:hypothetical protein